MNAQRRRHIHVDMDGVAANFDQGYFELTGVWPTRYPDQDNVDWSKVEAAPNFFESLQTMPDITNLIGGIEARGFNWSFLTGCPKHIPINEDNQKIRWARARWPDRVVNCCRSRDKFRFCTPGDVLIDDYLKYRDAWCYAGGIFIHHTSAAESIRQLNQISDFA